MRVTIFLLIGIFLIVMQTTILQVLPAWFGFPDFVFILIAFLAFRFDWLSGCLLAFMLGWMMDVVSSIYLGMFVVKYLIVFFVLNMLTQNSPVKEAAYQVPLVGISYFLIQCGFYAALTLAAADLVSPPGVRANALTSDPPNQNLLPNQSLYNGSGSIPIRVGDFVFFHPHQSDAMSQFEDRLVMRDGKLIDTWKPFSKRY